MRLMGRAIMEPSVKLRAMVHKLFDEVARQFTAALQRVLPDRQLLVVGGSGNGAVDLGEPPAALLLPLPDPGGSVIR
jgi:hypothetical protein